MTHFEIIVSLLAGIVAVLGGLAVAVRWVYRQGAAGADLLAAVKANTTAQEDLTAAQDKLADAFRDGALRTDEKLTDHERRISRIEGLRASERRPH